MGISTRLGDGNVTVVVVEGQLIVANRQELKQTIQDALDGGARRFVVDFGPTAYIDSSGLGALVSINKKVRELGGELRLAGLNEDLRSLFELTKLDTLFAIADSANQA
ncbi:MAG TPA: STAS domain-containing protein, partial [Gemmatimonadales bacterium]|nr:STAS domain-containing protein [Gemmatimonadales bacterium]